LRGGHSVLLAQILSPDIRRQREENKTELIRFVCSVLFILQQSASGSGLVFRRNKKREKGAQLD
jgi:hypothetical protein